MGCFRFHAVQRSVPRLYLIPEKPARRYGPGCVKPETDNARQFSVNKRLRDATWREQILSILLENQALAIITTLLNYRVTIRHVANFGIL
jgi:hypothetical protein